MIKKTGTNQNQENLALSLAKSDRLASFQDNIPNRGEGGGILGTSAVCLFYMQVSFVPLN